MKLTPDQARAFRSWLSSRGGVLLDCPVCRRRDWLPPEMLSTVRSMDNGHAAPAETYDEIIVVCALCGYTYRFAAGAFSRTS